MIPHIIQYTAAAFDIFIAKLSPAQFLLTYRSMAENNHFTQRRYMGVPTAIPSESEIAADSVTRYVDYCLSICAVAIGAPSVCGSVWAVANGQYERFKLSEV